MTSRPEPLTEQQLDDIETRADATRSGPWTLSDDLEGDGYPGHLWVVRTPDAGPDEPDDQAVVISIGDRALGEFIAHARTDVPALLAEVRRLRFRIAELGEQGPDDRETVAEAAQMYRSLRPAIERTMVDSDRWDGDEDESFHLARYVEWLAAEAGHAEATLERARRVASRLAAHAVGFGDVLDESDRGPWGRTVGADIAELSNALSPDADDQAAAEETTR